MLSILEYWTKMQMKMIADRIMTFEQYLQIK